MLQRFQRIKSDLAFASTAIPLKRKAPQCICRAIKYLIKEEIFANIAMSIKSYKNTVLAALKWKKYWINEKDNFSKFGFLGKSTNTGTQKSASRKSEYE